MGVDPFFSGIGQYVSFGVPGRSIFLCPLSVIGSRSYNLSIVEVQFCEKFRAVALVSMSFFAFRNLVEDSFRFHWSPFRVLPFPFTTVLCFTVPSRSQTA